MAEETVTTTAVDDGLPSELKGKSPKEVMEYFQERERILMDRINQPPQPTYQAPPAPESARAPSREPSFDIFNDPLGSVTRTVDKRVNEQMDRMTRVAQPGLVAAARMAAMNQHADFAKFRGDVERIMATMTPEAQMNPEFWEIAYLTAKGKAADRMVEEAVSKAKSPVEAPTPAAREPEKPRELSKEEAAIADELGLTEDAYRNASKRYVDEDGRLPITTDSRKPKVRPKNPDTRRTA